MGALTRLGRRLVTAGATAVLIGEAAHCWAARVGYGTPPRAPGERRALIVLGYPSRPGGGVHPLQQWRCRIAARSCPPGALVVFSGGPDASGRSEAAAMADLGRRFGVPADRVVLEERATSTWQNIEFSAPLVAGADVIVIISNPLHALRGRRFLRRQWPELADRLAPAADYRFGEYWWLKAPLTWYEIVATVREWRSPRLPQDMGRWRADRGGTPVRAPVRTAPSP